MSTPGQRSERKGRCPDGGYCHGSSLAAGPEPCSPGRCLRVITSGPLSNVFPGDRWPEDMVLAACLPPAVNVPDPEPEMETYQVPGPPPLPPGRLERWNNWLATLRKLEEDDRGR